MKRSRSSWGLNDDLGLRILDIEPHVLIVLFFTLMNEDAAIYWQGRRFQRCSYWQGLVWLGLLLLEQFFLSVITPQILTLSQAHSRRYTWAEPSIKMTATWEMILHDTLCLYFLQLVRFDLRPIITKRLIFMLKQKYWNIRPCRHIESLVHINN